MSIEIDWTRMFEVIKSGYGGVLASGTLVDRREYPQAIPIAENTLLCAPKPKDVDELTREQLAKRPPFVRLET
jgi:hypothetical protein